MKLLSELARLTALRLLLQRDQFLDSLLKRRLVLSTHITSREFRSPRSKWTSHEFLPLTELYFRIWWTLGRKKVLDKSHEAVVLVHNLNHLYSPESETGDDSQTNFSGVELRRIFTCWIWRNINLWLMTLWLYIIRQRASGPSTAYYFHANVWASNVCCDVARTFKWK